MIRSHKSRATCFLMAYGASLSASDAAYVSVLQIAEFHNFRIKDNRKGGCPILFTFTFKIKPNIIYHIVT